MKIKTKDLTGAALDWAMAKCEGKTTTLMRCYVASKLGDEVDVPDELIGRPA